MEDLGDELRQYAERLEREKAEREKQAAEREGLERSKEQAIARRVRTVGERYLVKAQGLRDKARRRIFLRLDTAQTSDSFWLDVGKPRDGRRGMQARLAGDVWRVQIHRRLGGDGEKVYRDDAEFERASDELLRPLMKEAIEGLINENEEMSSER